jgi:hypothetical protein
MANGYLDRRAAPISWKTILLFLNLKSKPGRLTYIENESDDENEND